MNNKKLGTEFEKETCEFLAKRGWWVHFMSPDNTGAQPFDIIAAKNSKTVVIDCKTCVADTFNIRRLEENQIMAFRKWYSCGCDYAYIFIKHKGEVYVCAFGILDRLKSVNIKILEKAGDVF